MVASSTINIIEPSILVETLVPMPRILNVDCCTGSTQLHLKLEVEGGLLSIADETSKVAPNIVDACEVMSYRDQYVKTFTYLPSSTVSNKPNEHGLTQPKAN